MDQHLYKYLVLYKHLSIPQLGSFVIENEKARYDVGSGLLHAPKPVIFFTQDSTLISEKLFFDFLTKELGVDELAAIKLFHDFAYQFRSDLMDNGMVELKGVGTLTKEADEKISFEQAHNLSDFFPLVKPGAAIPIVDQSTEIDTYEETETIEAKDPWWMYAIILLVLGAGALIVYYI